MMKTLWGLIPLGRWNPWVPLPDAHAGLNSLGLPSKGVDAAVRNIAAFRKAHAGGALDDFPIGVGFHHMCTTRMAEDAREGVVDAHCRVHDVDNLWVAGSSVFGTGGVATPTYTIVALATRLADHLRDVLA